MRKGVAQAAKTGWVYILDRVPASRCSASSKRAVMQEPQQHTSPTQPFPVGDADRPEVASTSRRKATSSSNEGRIFTPFSTTGGVEAARRRELAAELVRSRTNYMYICATDCTWGALAAIRSTPSSPARCTRAASCADPRRRGAASSRVVDLKTNRIAWRQQWIEQCYSGSIVTAGGLVFVGRNDGRLTALDKANGERLWEFQTDGGVNAPASTFEYEGKQYVVVLAGGTALAGSKRATASGCSRSTARSNPLPRGSADPVATPRGGPPARGRADRTRSQQGQGQGALHHRVRRLPRRQRQRRYARWRALHRETNARNDRATVVTNGRNDMPAVRQRAHTEAIQDLTAYVLELASRD